MVKKREEEKAGQQLQYCSISSNDFDERSQQQIEVEGNMKVF